MVAVTICSDFGAPQSQVSHCFPIYLPWSNGTRCHDLSFLSAEFYAKFFTFLFHFHQSATRMVSSTYLRLLIFLPVVLIPACASSSPALRMMYSAYKLNKQGDNIQPWRAPFPIWNLCCSMSSSNCCFSTCIQISQEQVRWSGIPISWRIFQFVVIHTVKGCGSKVI